MTAGWPLCTPSGGTRQSKHSSPYSRGGSVRTANSGWNRRAVASRLGRCMPPPCRPLRRARRDEAARYLKTVESAEPGYCDVPARLEAALRDQGSYRARTRHLQGGSSTQFTRIVARYRNYTVILTTVPVHAREYRFVRVTPVLMPPTRTCIALVLAAPGRLAIPMAPVVRQHGRAHHPAAPDQ